jgi:hypothetical protein
MLLLPMLGLRHLAFSQLRKYGTSLIPKVGRRSDRSQTLLIIMWGTNKVQSLSASSPSCYDGTFNLPYVYSSPASFIRR